MKCFGMSWLIMMTLMMAMTGGCGRQGHEPTATSVRPRAQTGAYQFIEETGFSVDLGQQPQFEPQVAAYQVAGDLSNVANLELFRDDLRPEHLKDIAEKGFVVVPADWK